MMEDRTDIIGEELGNISEPLPADDWNVLQQKYAAARRRRKAAVFAWIGGVTSAAAAVALALLLIRPAASPSPETDIMAEVQIPEELPVQTDTVAVEDVQPSVLTPVSRSSSTPRSARTSLAAAAVVPYDGAEHAPTTGNVASDDIRVIEDTVSVADRLLADAGDSAHSTGSSDSGLDKSADESAVDADSDSGWRFEDFDEEKPIRAKRPISVGLSGSGALAGGGLSLMAFEPSMDATPVPQPPLDYPDMPQDSLSTGGNVPMGMRKVRSGYTDSYEHDMPVSAGVSVRFMLTKRFSINTGLNYTLYSSMRERLYSSTQETERERQNVHYIGIPVRCDWLLVNREHFSFYMGVGAQVDKCIYARVGGERLHEREFLFSLTGAAGIQYNFTRKIGLYLEPDFAIKLNDGSLDTFRYDNSAVVSVRAGLRFNF